MAQTDQVLSHCLGGRLVVEADGGVASALDDFTGVDHWRGLNAVSREGVVGAQLNHAIGLVRVDQVGKLTLDVFASLGIAQQQSVTGSLGSQLRTADHAGKKGIGNFRNQDHQVGSAP
ncbi:hypothetical protein D3C73_762140 [compost metagenome]